MLNCSNVHKPSFFDVVYEVKKIDPKCFNRKKYFIKSTSWAQI
jgi:hypothetical protein